MFESIRAAVASIPRNLFIAALLLTLLPLVGTAGYITLEGWSFMDALYMTIMTETTIGFREVQPLDDDGRIFTMLLAITGVGAMFYALLGLVQFLLEGELGAYLGGRRMKGRIGNLREHYVLCGYGRVGSEVAHEFRGRGVPFVIVESNPEAIEAARQAGCLVVHGDATTDTVLRDAGIDWARGLVAASDSDSGNTFIALTAKALRPDIYVVSRAGRKESEARMKRAGADRVFSPYVIAGRQMAISALKPIVVELIDTLESGIEGAPIVAEIDVTEASGLPGQTVEHLLHTCRTMRVLGLRKPAGELTVGPSTETVLEEGDRLIVHGSEEDLEALKPAALSRAARARGDLRSAV